MTIPREPIYDVPPYMTTSFTGNSRRAPFCPLPLPPKGISAYNSDPFGTIRTVTGTITGTMGTNRRAPPRPLTRSHSSLTYCPPPKCPVKYGTYRTTRPSFPPPAPPVGHDRKALNAIIEAFESNPKAERRQTTSEELEMYKSAYAFRFQHGQVINRDDVPLTHEQTKRVADWIVTCDFDTCLQMYRPITPPPPPRDTRNLA